MVKNLYINVILLYDKLLLFHLSIQLGQHIDFKIMDVLLSMNFISGSKGSYMYRGPKPLYECSNL